LADNKKKKEKKLIFFLDILHFRNFYPTNMPVREISNDSLNGELTSAGDKLVIVDFFATWFELSYFILYYSINHFIYRCGPCKTIAPHMDHLSSQYSNAIFLKADVEKCTVEI
jgi:thiol-disulfide isomerase/thioredoxin